MREGQEAENALLGIIGSNICKWQVSDSVEGCKLETDWCVYACAHGTLVFTQVYILEWVWIFCIRLDPPVAPVPVPLSPFSFLAPLAFNGSIIRHVIHSCSPPGRSAIRSRESK